MERIVGQLVDPIITAMTPRLKQLSLEAAEAAKPAIREVLREEVVPKVSLALILGLAAVGALAAAIGSHFATRRRSNPPRALMSYRRRAA